MIGQELNITLKDAMYVIAEKALRLYSLSESAIIRLISQSENTTFLIEDLDSSRYILRIGRYGYHTPEDISEELLWMSEVKTNTLLTIPDVIPTITGEEVSVIKHPYAPKYYNCVLFTFIEGHEPTAENVTGLIDKFELLGEITATLHKNVKAWEKSAALNRFTWDYETLIGENARLGAWKEAPGLTSEMKLILMKTCETIKKRLDAYGKTPDRFGLIHSDLRLANLIEMGQEIAVIDFDDCGYGWHLYDFASAITFIEHEPYVPELITSWVKGYRNVQELSQEAIDELPTFIMLRRLCILGWIASHTDSDAVTSGELKDYPSQTVKLALDYLKKFI